MYLAKNCDFFSVQNEYLLNMLEIFMNTLWKNFYDKTLFFSIVRKLNFYKSFVCLKRRLNNSYYLGLRIRWNNFYFYF